MPMQMPQERDACVSQLVRRAVVPGQRHFSSACRDLGGLPTSWNCMVRVVRRTRYRTASRSPGAARGGQPWKGIPDWQSVGLGIASDRRLSRSGRSGVESDSSTLSCARTSRDVRGSVRMKGSIRCVRSACWGAGLASPGKCCRHGLPRAHLPTFRRRRTGNRRSRICRAVNGVLSGTKRLSVDYRPTTWRASSRPFRFQSACSAARSGGGVLASSCSR